MKFYPRPSLPVSVFVVVVDVEMPAARNKRSTKYRLSYHTLKSSLDYLINCRYN